MPTLQADTPLSIRPCEDRDLAAMARLFRACALAYIVHEAPPEGASNFLRDNDEEGLRGFVRSGHVYHVALAGDELAGFVAIRNNDHLYHLFVDPRWHRRGLARRLWDVARAEALARGGPGAFTVNASNYAVPVYEAFGFERSGPLQCVKGMQVNPMRLTPHALQPALQPTLR